MIVARSRLLVALLLALTLGVIAAHAAPTTPYSKQAFVEAQNADKPIVVYVHAAW